MTRITGWTGTVGVCLLLAALAVLAAAAIHSATVGAEEKAPAIDWNYARQLLQKSNSVQALTSGEESYLDRAKEERRKGGGPGGAQPPVPPPPPPTATRTGSSAAASTSATTSRSTRRSSRWTCRPT